MLPHKWWTLGVTCLSWYFLRSFLWRFAGGFTITFSNDLVRFPFPLYPPLPLPLPPLSLSSDLVGCFSFSPFLSPSSKLLLDRDTGL